jgi:hypothetical protein
MSQDKNKIKKQGMLCLNRLEMVIRTPRGVGQLKNCLKGNHNICSSGYNRVYFKEQINAIYESILVSVGKASYENSCKQFIYCCSVVM